MLFRSGQAVSATEDILAAAVAHDVPAFEAGMQRLLETYRKINEVMETMWARSKPSDYLAFRTFIFGTAPKQGNPMFPDGVRYEGVRDEKYHLRGESGANDSLVPLYYPEERRYRGPEAQLTITILSHRLDNLLEITSSLPNNELTEILRDFRE